MPQEASLSILALLRQDLPSAPAADICTDIPADPAVCERILHADPAYEGMDVLAEHLLLSVRSRENGPWKRIPEQVFLDTMGCFSSFVREYFRSYGTWGFDRGFWTTRQAEAKLFRIGTLEYELSDEPEEAAKKETVKKKTAPEEIRRQINLHIPSDADLRPNCVEDSFHSARAFLAGYFPDWASLPIHLESWLLSPALEKLLPPSSRILQFQKYFMLKSWDPDPEDYLEWVFQIAGGQRDNVQISKLPENTHLQKAMKAYVLQGGKIGVAQGVLKEIL